MKGNCLRVCILLSAALGARADVTFTLAPADGSLEGTAGTAVGWGYTISTTTDYVTIESISFGDLTPIGVFSTPGIPSSVASAGSPITTSWVEGISGLQYDISSSAILGASTEGVMTLTYDTFSDPGLTNQIGFGDTVNAQFDSADVLAQVTVNGVAPPTTVPEPSFSWLVVPMLGLVLFRARTFNRRSRPSSN